jgi:hypothetical protein
MTRKNEPSSADKGQRSGKGPAILSKLFRRGNDDE